MRASHPDTAAGLFDPVAFWATTAGDRVAIVVDDAERSYSITYAELDAETARWERLLAQRDIGAQDRVAVLARNRAETVAVFFACLRRQATLVPLDWRLTERELAKVLAHAEPALVIGEHEFASLADAAWRGRGGAPERLGTGPRPKAGARSVAAARALPWLALHSATANVGSAPARSADPSSPEAIVMLLYTSGSSGEPKAVCIPQRQLYWNAVATVEGWALDANDVGLVMTPLFHTAGWHVFLTPLLWCGGRTVLLTAFAVDRCLAALARHDVTMAFAVPTQLDMLQHGDAWGQALPRLRTIISGGAPCPPSTLAAVRAAGYRVRDAYGLTECGPNCFVATDEQVRSRPGYVGWPMPMLRSRVVDASGHPVPAGMPGELQLRGPQVCAGYFRDAGLTAALFTPDGWLRTGDLAIIETDGAHAIRGRLSEVYISGGENIMPAEVEAALRTCTGVRDAGVVGVPDPHWGETGFAVVEAIGSAPDAATLRSELRQRLAGYKMPRHLHVVPALPRLANGKVDRRALRALALRLAAGA